MYLLDYLIYFLTNWFDENKDKLKWSTPLQRACYACGLATLCIAGGIAVIFAVVFNINSEASLMVYILGIALGLFIISLYRYLYIKKDRFNLILKNKFKNANKEKGKMIAIIFIISSFIIPFVLMFILVKPVVN